MIDVASGIILIMMLIIVEKVFDKLGPVFWEAWEAWKDIEP